MNKREEKSVRLLDQNEKNLLFSAFSHLLDEINYPIHKKEKTKVMFKRMMGRALPSKWEYHTLMGVLRTAAEKLGEKHSDH
jgi:tRNA C32,U32 (ribose-2'-O)-methylase TrmJ